MLPAVLSPETHAHGLETKLFLCVQPKYWQNSCLELLNMVTQPDMDSYTNLFGIF